MVLSDISIKRPVLATVMSLLIVLLGVISFDRLSVREYPKIDPPTVSVRTVYKGATAQVVESVITTPVEDALSGIEGIKTIKSQSREEVSQITVTFVTDRDVEAAANDVRDRVSRVKALLPDQADDPDHLIDPAVAVNRGENTKRHAKDDADDRRDRREFQRRGEISGDVDDDRVGGQDGPSEIALHRLHGVEIELLPQRKVQAEFLSHPIVDLGWRTVADRGQHRIDRHDAANQERDQQ